MRIEVIPFSFQAAVSTLPVTYDLKLLPFSLWEKADVSDSERGMRAALGLPSPGTRFARVRPLPAGEGKLEGIPSLNYKKSAQEFIPGRFLASPPNESNCLTTRL